MDNEAHQATAELARIPVPENRDRADLVHGLLEHGQHHQAQAELQDWLSGSPDDFDALFMLCRLSIDTDKAAFARPIAITLQAKHPDRVQSHAIRGMVEAALQRADDALPHLMKAQQIWPDWPLTLRVLCNVYVMLHRFDEARAVAEKALQHGDHYLPHVALGFYHLHRREWRKGFEHYARQMGHAADRPKNSYGLKPWKGKGRVLVYGEQGLGDQLAYASCLDDRCGQVVCHPKLANLLRRSLDVPVYGDQFAKQIAWQPTAHYEASMSEAMIYQKVERRDRWLKPHPEKSVQWGALMHAVAKVKQRPWVGIAWTGGRTGTHGWQGRNITPNDLAPILALDANIVSLEYRPHDPIPNVHCWPWATQTDDLDDFAALVDNLSAVVCVPTTAYHVAGGLGIPCHVIVHDKPHFHEGQDDGSPYWGSVTFHRRSDGLEQVVRRIADKLARDL